MSVTRIKFRSGAGAVFQTALLETRPDVGPEIRHHKAADCDAGPSMALDVPYAHCHACRLGFAERLGLTEDDVDRITRWREASKMTPDQRKQEGMTASDLGRILDRIVNALDDVADCDNNSDRIVVEVEPTP